MRNWSFVVPQQIWRLSVIGFAYAIALPVLAHAHGGMEPNEVGPPIVTSGLVGFACYWLVMLWPSSKRKTTEDRTSIQEQPPPRTVQQSHKNSARVKRAPHLRKIEGSGQIDSDQTSRRRVNNG